MITHEELIETISAIEALIGYTFQNPSLLGLALTHRSYINEHKEIEHHNERLEFLGDSILGLVVADYLYNHFPDMPEGDLSYLRSRLVEAKTCVCYFQKLNLSSYILLGKGENQNQGRQRASIQADTFEALIGAIYLDGGIESARSFLFDHFESEIASILQTPLKNWKAELQDFCQRTYQETPVYHVENEEGPDHKKWFRVSVHVHDKILGFGEGKSKKQAQQDAAKDALEKMA